MTIKELVNACTNSHPEIKVEIFNTSVGETDRECLYSGLYENLTERMLNREVDYFEIKKMFHTEYMRYYCSEMKIVLEYMAEYR